MSQLVTIRLYRHPMAAHAARSLLSSDGVTALVSNENYEMFDGPTWPSDGVRLQVPIEQAARARDLLDTPSSPEEPTDA